MNSGLKLTFLSFSFMLLFFVVFAEEGTEEDINAVVVDIGVGGINIEATGVNCFDYYNFGSIQFIFPHAEKHHYNAGDTVNFITTVKNNNPYPIVEGGVFAQVYWVNEESGDTQGDNLIDEFWVIEDLSLDTNQEYPLTFSWRIPEKAPKGYYYAALFFQVKKSFNLSGLPFVNNVYGGTAGFNVENGQEKPDFYFDRNTVRLQGKHQILRHFSKSFAKNEEIEYRVALKNPKDKPTSVYVEYNLYYWDYTNEENLLPAYTKKEFLDIDANSQTDAVISFSGLEPGAYLLKIKGEANGWQNSINLRFSVEGNKGRFIFSGIDKFPLEKGDSFTLFSCFSNSTDWFTSFNGRVEVELTANGKTIGKVEYSGEVTPKIIAVKKELTADEGIDKALLTSRIYGPNGEKHQEITIIYDFSKFRTEKAYNKYYAPKPVDTDNDGVPDERDECPNEAGPKENNGCPVTPTPPETPKPEQPIDMTMVGIGAAVIIVILLIVYFMKKR